MKFSFENNNNDYSAETSYREIIENLNLSDHVGKRNQNLIKALCGTNIRNIFYYREKIKTENLWRNIYAGISVVLVIGIPLFIFHQTYYTEQKLDLLQYKEGFVIALVGSLLGFHKLISSWIEKRKFRSHFHQAKVDLTNIIYTLIEDHQWQDDLAEEENSQEFHYVTPELQEALILGIKKSRETVDAETKQFFELSASPAFDISAVLSSSAATAQSLFTSFKSKKFEAEMNYLLEEDKEKRAEEKERKKATAKNEMDIQIISRKLKRLLDKENELNDRIDLIDAIEKSKRTEHEQKMLDKYLEKLEALEAEMDSLEDQYGELEIKMKLSAL